MGKIQPFMRVLSQDQIDQIHCYSVMLLSSIGIRVDSRRARSLFAKATGDAGTGEIVRIPKEFVERALKTAPATIDVYDRNGKFGFQLGGNLNGQTRFGVGVTNLYYQNPITDAVVPFGRSHMETSTRLGNALVGFDVVSTTGVIQDLPPERTDLIGTLEMIANTTKPLVVLISEKRFYETTLDMLEHLHGDLALKPFVIPYFNPISPLVLNKDTTDAIFSTIARGLPFIYNNYGMAGATSPITPDASLILLNAELLAGLVFSQLVKEGTPIILGSLPANFDMHTMSGAYTYRTMLLNLACAEMMAGYGLPHSGTSGSGPGWGPDLLAGGMLWMNHLSGCMGKVGLAPFVGGNFDSMVFSPAMVVYSDEVIQQARLFASGFSFDETSPILKEIESIGPGGNFLLSDLTVELCREMDCSSSIWPKLTLDQWQDKGNPKADDMLRRHTLDLLNDLRPPDDHAELIAKGEAFIRDPYSKKTSHFVRR